MPDEYRINLSTTDVFTVTDVVGDIRLRSSLTTQRLQSAVLFAHWAKLIEEQRPLGAEIDHRAYVIASITESAAFLEATASEFLCNVLDEVPLSWIPDLSKDAKQKFNEKYGVLEWKPVVDKFKSILKICGKEAISLGSQPGQDCKTLIELRNSLTHYKPRWRATGPEIPVEEDNRIGALEGGFSNNPFVSENNPFFPDRILGFGCSKWAIDTAVKYADEFYSRFQVRPPYEDIRDRVRFEV